MPHLEVADLWVQDRVRKGDFALEKVWGPQNPADILTKYVEAHDMRRHLEFLDLSFATGRAAATPHIAAAWVQAW